MLRKIEKSIFLTKPIIGIVGRKDNEIIKVNNSIVKAIIKCGGNPILILPSNRLKDILKICDGIVMPGGTDIYDYDKYICNYAIENDIPLFGICLGMQIMVNTIELNIKNHNNVTHKITTIKGSIIGKIIGNSYVNSRHNYHVVDVGNYKVTAYSDDGIIEAIEYPNKKFNIGVQWHPEDMIDFDIKQFNLIKEFINATECK
ncbi:MAG: gamma-glutamyl-gamma-aminobutyrate hydrolase family protein [Bacilli bacterium]|nr:gamma-glutamyl-gamma-aminobutyrate hydrolase family protein [Bacilli bacterium]